jgi:DNA-binding transcriptional LysR family regulator
MNKLVSLKVFCRIVESGSFAQCARDIGLSPAMVTKHISALEDDLGVRLLNRTTRKVSTTEAGREYFERSAQIISDLEEADAAVSQLGTNPRGILRLSSPLDFGTSHLLPAISAYLMRYPDVTVDIDFSDRRVQLIEEGFDVAVRFDQLADSTLVARRLNATKIFACASPKYLETHPPISVPADLAQHNCLRYAYYKNPSEWVFDGEGRSEKVKVQGSVLTNNGRSLCEMASHGLGVVLQPEFLVADYLKSGELVRVLDRFEVSSISLYVVYPHRRFLSAKVRSFVDFLVEHFSGEVSWSNS